MEILKVLMLKPNSVPWIKIVMSKYKSSFFRISIEELKQRKKQNNRRQVDSKNEIFIKYNFKITFKSDRSVSWNKEIHTWQLKSYRNHWLGVCDTYMRDIMFTLQAFPHFWRAKYTWEKTANLTCTYYIDNLVCDSYHQVIQIKKK